MKIIPAEGYLKDYGF